MIELWLSRVYHLPVMYGKEVDRLKSEQRSFDLDSLVSMSAKLTWSFFIFSFFLLLFLSNYLHLLSFTRLSMNDGKACFRSIHLHDFACGTCYVSCIYLSLSA